MRSFLANFKLHCWSIFGLTDYSILYLSCVHLTFPVSSLSSIFYDWFHQETAASLYFLLYIHLVSAVVFQFNFLRADIFDILFIFAFTIICCSIYSFIRFSTILTVANRDSWIVIATALYSSLLKILFNLIILSHIFSSKSSLRYQASCIVFYPTSPFIHLSGLRTNVNSSQNKFQNYLFLAVVFNYLDVFYVSFFNHDAPQAKQ